MKIYFALRSFIANFARVTTFIDTMNKTLFLCFAFIMTTMCCAAENSTENPLAEIKETPGFCSIFHKWGFIGDSLCSGEHEYHKEDGSTGYADLYEYSWGSRMCAAMGTEGDVYSQGGETAGGWIKNFWDNPKNNNNNIDAKLSPKQVYVIALGCNDTNIQIPAGDVTTDVDTLDYKNNAATFAGNYAGIIQRLKTIAPDAKFFVVTRPDDGTVVEAYNDVIRSMATLFDNTYIIDLKRHAPVYDDEFKQRYYMGGHLTAMGYQLTAWMMMTYIDWIIRNNPQDFKQAAFINTPMKN